MEQYPQEITQEAPTIRSRGKKEIGEVKLKLEAQQEAFCQYFMSPTEFYGNGVQSYAAAYDKKITSFNYDSIRAASARLLINPNVIKRLNELLDDSGFNDENVDKQLLFLINQGADFRSKLGALKEYNKLKQRITEKMQIEMPVAAIRIFPVQAIDVTHDKLPAPSEVDQEPQDDDSE